MNKTIVFKTITKYFVMERIMGDNIDDIYYVNVLRAEDTYRMDDNDEDYISYLPLKSNINIDFDFVKKHDFMVIQEYKDTNKPTEDDPMRAALRDADEREMW